MIEGLATGHRVVAFDNRGAGRSGKPDTPYSIELMAGDALGLMDALAIPEAPSWASRSGAASPWSWRSATLTAWSV